MTARAIIILVLLVGVAAAQPIGKVVQRDRDGSNSVGSATLIAKDDVQAAWLTARHVVSGTGPVTITPHNGTPLEAYKVDRHPTLDVAVVLTPPDVAFAPIKIGDNPRVSVSVTGYSWGQRFEARPARFQRFDATGQEGIWVGVGAISGQSGGAVYSPDTHVLVGVVSGSDGQMTVGPACRPIRNWLSTLGWRFRRARTEAWKYTQLNCGPDGCVEFSYPQGGYSQEPDQPPRADLNRPHTPAVGGVPKPQQTTQSDIEQRLSRLERIVAELPTRNEVTEQIGKVAMPDLSAINQRLDQHDSRIAAIGTRPIVETERLDVQDQRINELTDAMARLADASTSLSSQVSSLSVELGAVIEDVKKISDLKERINALESRRPSGDFQFQFGPAGREK
jgi:hypothetical protein